MSDEVGYKKPPKHRQFGQPNGNRPGLTSEAAYALHEANEKTAKMYLEMITAVQGKIEAMKTAEDSPDEYAALVAIKGDILRLMKDIMDRHMGTPRQSMDLSSEDGSMSPAQATQDAFLAALRAKGADK